MSTDATPIHVSLMAGGIAGLTVDVALFPLDTLKTRLQAPQGFFAAGGFNGLYKGMQSVVLGSAPGSALFFLTYNYFSDQFKQLYKVDKSKDNYHSMSALAHLSAASLGEMAACLVRVPTDNVKVKQQSGVYNEGLKAVKEIYKGHTGVSSMSGFFRGFGATICRDVPFSMVQFPLYELLKIKTGSEESPLGSALCGSVAGGAAAAISTPLDVVRTRLMIGKDNHGVAYNGALSTLTRIYEEGVLKEKMRKLNTNTVILELGDLMKYKSGGISLLFSGITPRMAWISIGGSVFFGAYESAKFFFRKVDTPKQL